MVLGLDYQIRALKSQHIFQVSHKQRISLSKLVVEMSPRLTNSREFQKTIRITSSPAPTIVSYTLFVRVSGVSLGVDLLTQLLLYPDPLPLLLYGTSWDFLKAFTYNEVAVLVPYKKGTYNLDKNNYISTIISFFHYKIILAFPYHNLLIPTQACSVLLLGNARKGFRTSYQRISLLLVREHPLIMYGF